MNEVTTPRGRLLCLQHRDSSVPSFLATAERLLQAYVEKSVAASAHDVMGVIEDGYIEFRS